MDRNRDLVSPSAVGSPSTPSLGLTGLSAAEYDIMRRGMNALLVLLAALAALTAAKRRPSSSRGSKIIVQWVAIEQCPEVPESNLSYVLRAAKGGDVFVDWAWTVAKSAKTISLQRQDITSCFADGSGCEHFMTMKSPMDGCTFVEAKNVFWTPAFANIRPPFVCPIAATRYTNTNWTVDKDLLNMLPFPRNRLYKARAEMWNEKGELFWCFVFQVIHKLYKPRNRQGSSRQ